jgi:hypothetical protein
MRCQQILFIQLFSHEYSEAGSYLCLVVLSSCSDHQGHCPANVCEEALKEIVHILNTQLST